MIARQLAVLFFRTEAIQTLHFSASSSGIVLLRSHNSRHQYYPLQNDLNLIWVLVCNVQALADISIAIQMP